MCRRFGTLRSIFLFTPPMKMEHRVFRNAGTYNSDAKKLPLPPNTTFKTRWKFEMKNNTYVVIGMVLWRRDCKTIVHYLMHGSHMTALLKQWEHVRSTWHSFTSKNNIYFQMSPPLLHSQQCAFMLFTKLYVPVPIMTFLPVSEWLWFIATLIWNWRLLFPMCRHVYYYPTVLNLKTKKSFSWKQFWQQLNHYSEERC
jgi:hypothetical protein